MYKEYLHVLPGLIEIRHKEFLEKNKGRKCYSTVVSNSPLAEISARERFLPKLTFIGELDIGQAPQFTRHCTKRSLFGIYTVPIYILEGGLE